MPLPTMEQFIEDLAHSLGSWAYLLVAFMATAETAAFLGFIAPGEFTIILGGVLAGEGTLSIWLLIGIVWASIVVGDSIGFMLGRRLGRDFAERHGHRVRLTEERLQKVDAYFARHGGKTIFFGRWLGFVRPLMPFTAGTSGMAYRAVPSLRHPERGAVRQLLLPARLHLLAQLRAGRGDRRQGRHRVRHAGGARDRRQVRVQAPARPRGAPPARRLLRAPRAQAAACGRSQPCWSRSGGWC